jgi:hypothetical protein
MTSAGCSVRREGRALVPPAAHDVVWGEKGGQHRRSILLRAVPLKGHSKVFGRASAADFQFIAQAYGKILEGNLMPVNECAETGMGRKNSCENGKST